MTNLPHPQYMYVNVKIVGCFYMNRIYKYYNFNLLEKNKEVKNMKLYYFRNDVKKKKIKKIVGQLDKLFH